MTSSSGLWEGMVKSAEQGQEGHTVTRCVETSCEGAHEEGIPQRALSIWFFKKLLYWGITDIRKLHILKLHNLISFDIMYVFVKHYHNQDNEHLSPWKVYSWPLNGLFFFFKCKKNFFLKYFQQISLKNNRKNFCTFFIQIHQFLIIPHLLVFLCMCM